MLVDRDDGVVRVLQQRAHALLAGAQARLGLVARVERGLLGERRHDGAGHQLQHLHVALVERAGLLGEHLEHADGGRALAQRREDHGAHAQQAAGGAVDALVGLGIVAALHGAGAHAQARQAGGVGDAQAQVAGHGAAGAPHDGVLAVDEVDRRAVRLRELAQLVDDQLHERVQRQIGLNQQRLRLDNAFEPIETLDPLCSCHH